MFWSIAAAVLFAAAIITFLPLLRDRSLWKPVALAMVFIVPVASLWMYQQLGTPEGIDVTGSPDRTASRNTGQDPNAAHSAQSQELDAMITSMQERLTETEPDLEGWVLLGRTLISVQRFPEAVDALETADRISPENPQVMVDLVEARVYNSANGRISTEMVAMLQRALQLQPGMQKALWLMGIAESQVGNFAGAISSWEALLAQLEPGSSVAQSVQAQIDDANVRMTATGGEPTAMARAAQPMAAAEPEPAPAEEVEEVPEGIKVMVRAGDANQSSIPSGGVLYVVIRAAGPAMGPPLGVRRVIDPVLPLEIVISDADSMLKERLISSEKEVMLQARISLTGSPAARSGDWQSVATAAPMYSPETVELVIDQRVE